MINSKVKKRVARFLFIIFLLGSLLTVGIRPVTAEEAANPEITLDEAISSAVANSEVVQKAAKEVDRTEEIRNYQYDVLQGLSTEPAFTAAVEVPRSQLLTSDLTWRITKKSLTAAEDKVALDTCNKYWAILKNQKKVEAAEATLNAALKQLQVARAGERVGISMLASMSPTQYLIASESQYTGAQAALEAAKNDLASAYSAFNQNVGFAANDRPVLKDELIYTPLNVDNIDYEVAKVLENHPLVWQANEAVTLQEYLKNMMFYTGEYQPYEARQITVEQAQLDVVALKKLYEQVTRSTYYSAKNLEEGYNAMQQGIKSSEENLRVKKLMYEVGMSTAAEVAAEEQKIATARSDAFERLSQQAYMKLAFQKPWAVSQ